VNSKILGAKPVDITNQYSLFIAKGQQGYEKINTS